MKKNLINTLILAFGVTSISAQAANTFSFIGGGSVALVPGVLPGPPSGSWLSMLAQDTNSDGIADTNIYMPMYLYAHACRWQHWHSRPSRLADV